MATARKSATSTTSAAKKTAAKRTAAKKTTTTKRTAAKKVPARKSTASARSESNDTPSESAPTKKVPAMKVARIAAQQLSELTGREPECVIGIHRTDDGWQVELEVVESTRNAGRHASRAHARMEFAGHGLGHRDSVAFGR